jgi:O-acetylserine/cysteine efflux transporter
MRPLDILAALTVAAVWGGNFVAMRAGALEIPPYFLLGLRLLVAAAALVWFAKSPRGMLVPLAAISATLCTLHFGLALVGVRHIEAGAGAIAMQTSVPFAALVAWLIHRETFGWRRVAGTVMAFAGVAAIAGMPRIGARIDMFLVMIVSAFFFALASVQIRRLGAVDFMSVNAWISILGAPQAFLVSWLVEDGQMAALDAAAMPAIAGIFYMALVASVVGQGLWYWLLPRYPTNQVMPFTLLAPLLGVLFGVILLDEQPSWRLAAGAALTIGGVAVIVLRQNRAAAAAVAGGPTP